jgi:hypothetical protein
VGAQLRLGNEIEDLLDHLGQTAKKNQGKKKTKNQVSTPVSQP